MFPNPDYHAAVQPGMRWALRHLPFYGRWYRFWCSGRGDTALAAAKVDPDWPPAESGEPGQRPRADDVRSGSQPARRRWSVGRQGDSGLSRHREAHAAGQRQLAETAATENVELVRSGIDHIEADAVVDTDGTAIPQTWLVYATGFRVNDFRGVTGRHRGRRRRSAPGCGASGQPRT